MKKNYFLNFHVRKFLPALALVMAFSFSGKSQQTYTFTPCGATGSVGPTQTQINNSYNLTNLQSKVTATTNGIQTWTVPYTGNFRIEARGAQGGVSTVNSQSPGGPGASMRGDFALIAGEVIWILVGQQGENGTSTSAGGGGGGSFVVRTPYTTTNSILVIAGGGTGGGQYNASPGYTTTNGGSSLSGGAGGNNGAGGGGGSRAAGGGGFLTDGGPCSVSTTYSEPGQAFINGGKGGGRPNNTTCSSTFGTICAGGFGGGASHGGNCIPNGGAGGGYSGGGGSYNDDPGSGGSLNQGTNQVNASGVNSGDGKVIITELCSISIYASGTNSVNPMICSGNSLTLTTNAVSGYSWSTGATTNSIVVAPTTNTVYSLAATSSVACNTTAFITVTVSSAVPVLTVSATKSSICLGDSVALNVTGAVTHSWSNSVINNKYFFPTTTVTYTATGANGCGVATKTLAVPVAPLQIGLSSSNATVCELNTATLTASGGNTYTWSTSQTGSVAVVAPTGPTIYTVTGQLGKCFGTNSVSIQTKPNPTLTIVPSSTVLCSGKTLTLVVSGANSYTWVQPGLAGSNVTVQPTIPTNYQVYGTNSLGCIGTAQQVVITQPSPTVNVSGAQQPTICPGASATLNVTGADTYLWSTGSVINQAIVSPASTSVYTVTGTYTSSGCNGDKLITVVVAQPVLITSPSTTVCPGTALTLTASGTGHLWSNGGTTFFNNIAPTVATLYTVSANVNAGNNLICKTTASINVGIHPLPVVTASVSRAEICRFEKSTLSASGADTYLWLSTNSTLSSITFSQTQIQTHILKVVGTDVNGCKDTASVSVKVNQCTGISEFDGSALVRVYPNPSKGNFVIEGQTDGTFEILNELGQRVKQVELNGSNARKVNITGLSGGVYFVREINSSDNRTLKIIVE